MDFVTSEPGSDPIIVQGYFAVSPDKMFAAWTDPDIVMQWFGPAPNSLHSATIDLRQGGSWRFLETMDADKTIAFEGRYIAIEPGKRLRFTWSKVVAYAVGTSDATPASEVEVIFTAQGRGTFVQLVHSALGNEDTSRNFCRGWNFGFNTMAAVLPLTAGVSM